MSACVQCAIESVGRIMRKKREILILLTMLLTVALICGCSTKEEQNNEQKVEGVEIEEDTDTYRFVDVLGNEYEAELLDIPLIKQDLTRIEDQDGKKFYLDEDGETASRLGIDAPGVSRIWRSREAGGGQYVPKPCGRCTDGRSGCGRVFFLAGSQSGRS